VSRQEVVESNSVPLPDGVAPQDREAKSCR